KFAARLVAMVVRIRVCGETTSALTLMPPAPASSALTECPSNPYLPVSSSNLISRGAVPATAPGGVFTVACGLIGAVSRVAFGPGGGIVGVGSAAPTVERTALDILGG